MGSKQSKATPKLELVESEWANKTRHLTTPEPFLTPNEWGAGIKTAYEKDDTAASCPLPDVVLTLVGEYLLQPTEIRWMRPSAPPSHQSPAASLLSLDARTISPVPTVGASTGWTTAYSALPLRHYASNFALLLNAMHEPIDYRVRCRELCTVVIGVARLSKDAVAAASTSGKTSAPFRGTNETSSQAGTLYGVDVTTGALWAYPTPTARLMAGTQAAADTGADAKTAPSSVAEPPSEPFTVLPPLPAASYHGPTPIGCSHPPGFEVPLPANNAPSSERVFDGACFPVSIDRKAGSVRFALPRRSGALNLCQPVPLAQDTFSDIGGFTAIQDIDSCYLTVSIFSAADRPITTVTVRTEVSDYFFHTGR